jgi:hypothetical protein
MKNQENTLTQIRADIESGALTPMQVYEAMLAFTLPDLPDGYKYSYSVIEVWAKDDIQMFHGEGRTPHEAAQSALTRITEG